MQNLYLELTKTSSGNKVWINFHHVYAFEQDQNTTGTYIIFTDRDATTERVKERPADIMNMLNQK